MNNSYKNLFNSIFIPKNPGINTNHSLVGKVASFENGYGIPMQFEVIGVDEETNDIYLDWDSYWYPINERTRVITFN